nr:26S proteasome complex subunit SEM1 [Pelodiscus sinensis]|eukprot:XP_006114559.1 26S proteasome complex subunit SEM1 [Pelodiscus sinensis]
MDIKCQKYVLYHLPFWYSRRTYFRCSALLLFYINKKPKKSFQVQDWAGLDEDEDAHVWEDNWDDDNVEDDFSNQLRAELEKHGYKMETS